MTTRDIINLLNGATSKQLKKLKKKWEDVYYSTSIHTDGACPRYKLLNGNGYCEPRNYFGEKYQEIFNNRLFARHPREDDLTRQWRFAVYKPLTREPFLQLSELVLGTIFQDSNYSIAINNENDSKYILMQPSFEGYDLVGWMVNIGYGLMINDPNGYFVRMPKYAYNERQSDNSVQVYFVKSCDILHVSETDFIFKKDGYAYHIDKRTIWRYSYDPETREWYLNQKDATGYYSHLLDRLPIDRAGGQWNSQGFFESFYSKAIPIADEFVGSYSAEQLIDKEASHPYIQQAEEECGNCNGKGQLQMPCEECELKYQLVSCGVCHGSGYTSINPGDRLNVPADQMKDDLIKIINHDVSQNTYLHKKNIDIKTQLLDSLNLLKTDEAQSGVAKTIDQAKLHNFIAKIANHLFDNIIFNSIKDIIAYRNIISVDGKVSPYEYEFSIIKPTQYQIKTSYDLLKEYGEADKANLPISARKQMYRDFMDRQYSGDAIIKKKTDLLDYYDVLLCVPESEKLIKLTNGEISKDDLTLSLRLPNILEKIIIDKGHEWFIKTPIRGFEAIIDAYFQPYKSKAIEFTPTPEFE